MGYSDVFGGNLIFPSRVTYLALTTAIDVQLQWPTEQQITGGDVVADIIDANTTTGGLNIDMPDARNTSQGNKATFNNVSGNVFTVRDVTGGTIQSVQPGEQWVVVLTDNTTEAGVWTTFQLGGNAATQASASTLAGDGLRPLGSQLDQIIDSDVKAVTPFTVVNGDRAKCLVYTAGAGTCNLPSAGVVFNNWFFMLHNAGSGTLNIVPPSGTIDGSASLNLDPNGSCFIFTDGTDFFTIGLTVASTIAFDFISLAVPGSGDFVLSGANLNRISYRFTGALTGNRRIVVPNTTQQYWADNQTTGAFTLEVATAAGAGIFVPQGQSVILYCDATDVINATSSTSVAFPITIGQGGTSATTADGAMDNLGVGRDVLTPALGGLAGGGDLSADRNFVLDVDNLTLELAVDLATDTFAFYDDSMGMMRKATLDVLGLTVDGTPADDEIAVFTGPNAVEGDSNFRWTGAAFQIEGTGIFEIRVGTVTTFDLNGMTELNIRGMDENDDGLVLEDGMRLTFEDLAFANACYLRNEGIGGGSGTLTLHFSSSGSFIVHGGLAAHNGTNQVTFSVFNSPTRMNVSNAMRLQGSLYLMEQPTADTNIVANGQLWIDDDVPTRLRYTDDADNDFVVAISGGVANANVAFNNSFNFNTTDNRADNFIGFYNDGGNDTITLEDSGSEVNWPIFTTINIIAPTAGDITIVEGSGTTLFDSQGNDTIGGVVVSGGVVSITRITNVQYVIWGSGIT